MQVELWRLAAHIRHFTFHISHFIGSFAVPRVTMTPMTRFALYFLRFYLILLMGLLLFRFIKVFHH